MYLNCLVTIDVWKFLRVTPIGFEKRINKISLLRIVVHIKQNV